MQERLYLFPYEWKTVFVLFARSRKPSELPSVTKIVSASRQLGLDTNVIVDGCRGIDLEPDDIDRALDEIKRAGAVLLKSSDL